MFLALFVRNDFPANSVFNICLARILPDCSASLDPDLIADKIAGMINTVTGNSTVRVFFALWPDPAEQGAFCVWQTALKSLCGGRDMREDTLHATLIFLGEVDVTRLESLKLAAQEVVGDEFEVCFDEARYWRHNHIVYAAPGTVPPQLLKLAKALEQRLIAHRFSFDQRAFKPHVTLLRKAQWVDQALPDMPAVTWHIREFVLVQSAAGGIDANYRVLTRFRLM